MIGMCGDGANDCNALKQADVGISLSLSEASYAAPFTSKVKNISSIVTLLWEGWSSLVSGLVSFKFMELYFIIWFANQALLSFFVSFFNDREFLYNDIIIMVPLVVFIGFTGTSKKLSKKLPWGHLITIHNFTSVILHGIFEFIAVIIMIILIY